MAGAGPGHLRRGFGDARTALKFSAGRYMEGMTVGFTDNYSPLNRTWEYRDWQDCYRYGPGGNSCSGADPYSTNGDDIVQDWEVGPGQSDFGARRTKQPRPAHPAAVPPADQRRHRPPGNALARGHRGLELLGVEAVLHDQQPAADAQRLRCGGRTQSVRIRLNPPGSIYNERINVVDLSFGKLIDVGNARVPIGADIYNILNPDTILRQVDNYGASLGNVREVILGRFWKFLTQINF